MDIWRTIAERKIQEAMEEGAFRKLDGEGAPLELDEDPFTDPSLRMAHRLLKNNGFAPAWIEERREIDPDLACACEELRRAGPDAAAIERFRATAAGLRSRMAAWNLKTPLASAQKQPVDIDRLLERILGKHRSETQPRP